MTEHQERQEKVICPNCQHANEPDLTRCSKCGTELIKTIAVPEIVTLTAPFPAVPDVDVTPETLTLLVSGYKSPITAHRKRELVIGRRVPDHPIPDVDLTGYNAYKLGVSRRHAILRCSEDGCALEDQASANATWVNENKLTPFVGYPLQSGDTIRLGHLVIYVYFSTVDSIYLSDNTPGEARQLTPRYLIETVGPYLSALSELQNLVNTALEREQAVLTVGSIRHDSSDAIQVTLRRATETVNLILRRVNPWKIEHSAPTTEDYQQLAGIVLDRINPDMPDADKGPYKQKIAAVLKTLVASALSMSESPPKKK